jgi:Cu/Ag efflux protein CusF
MKFIVPVFALLPFMLAACGRGDPTAPAVSSPPAHTAATATPSPQSDDSAQGFDADETNAVGVIQAIDTTAGLVTIESEPIGKLGWPAMTMPFKVSNPALLQGIEPGEKVEFQLKGADMASIVVTGLAAAD